MRPYIAYGTPAQLWKKVRKLRAARLSRELLVEGCEALAALPRRLAEPNRNPRVRSTRSGEPVVPAGCPWPIPHEASIAGANVLRLAHGGIPGDDMQYDILQDDICMALFDEAPRKTR